MEVFLKRSHSQVPWGFRIIGGSDSHLPIIVSKVLKNSVAEKSGLQEDVLLERINNIPTFGLSHSEVNQVILTAEYELLLTIKRVNLETLILATLNDEETDSEISNILRQIINKDAIIEEENNSFQEEKGSEEIELKRELETSIVDFSRDQLQNRNNRPLPVPPPGKQWSTFLQKPKNPTPNDKFKPLPISKDSCYKVIITKQIKKEHPAPKITIDVPEEEQKQPEFEEKPDISMEAETNFEVRNVEDAQIQMEDYAAYSIENQEENIEQSEQIQEYTATEMEDYQDENEEKTLAEEESNGEMRNISDDTPTLEKQLAAVQKQLQELAQLPSTIQDTLSAVTQQLAIIVANKVQENVAEDEYTKEEESLDLATDKETQEIELGDLEPNDNAAEVLEEFSESAEMEGTQSEVLSDICEEQELSEIIEEEEIQQKPMETPEKHYVEENSQKKQLENQQILREEEETPLEKHFVRPIILPGGRKWVDPDDAVVKVKNPRMSDDKICNTIETFSEVIVGKVKGWTSGIAGGLGLTTRKGFIKASLDQHQNARTRINFLKYTPPTKNLEYLQRSDVYRLVHGMEPPVKGISLRSGKIWAEQDYYTPGGN